MTLRNLRRVAAFGLSAPDATAEERRSLDQLFSLTYEELRRLASQRQARRSEQHAQCHRFGQRGVAETGEFAPDSRLTSRLHFKRIAARAMRQVLIEAARRRNAINGAVTGKSSLFLSTTLSTALSTRPGKSAGARHGLNRTCSPRTAAGPDRGEPVSSEGLKSARFQACLACRRPPSCATGERPRPGWGKRFVGPDDFASRNRR